MKIQTWRQYRKDQGISESWHITNADLEKQGFQNVGFGHTEFGKKPVDVVRAAVEGKDFELVLYYAKKAMRHTYTYYIYAR